jgi:hypothetical protein
MERFPGPYGQRLYSHAVGSGHIAVEWEFESFEQRETYLTDYLADPGRNAFSEKYDELALRLDSNELWRLVE